MTTNRTDRAPRILRRLLLLSGMAVLFALSLSATASAAGWLPAFSLAEEGEVSRSAVAVDPAGDATYAWVQHLGGFGAVIRARVHHADGSVGPKRTVASPGDESSEYAIGADAAGEVRIAWLQVGQGSGGSDETQVMTAMLDAEGALAEAPLVVTEFVHQYNGDVEDLSLAVGTGGEAAVGFIRRPNGGLDELGVFEVSGRTVTPVTPTPASGAEPERLSVSIGVSGGTFATWVGRANGEEDVEGARLSPGSVGPTYILSPGSPERSIYDLVAAGDGTAVYTSYENGETGVEFSSLDAGGVVSAPTRISPRGTPGRTGPGEVAATPDGGVIVGWGQGEESGEPEEAVWSTAIDAAGVVGATHLLDAGPASLSDLGVASDGEGVALLRFPLEESEGWNGPIGLEQRSIDTDGEPTGPATQIGEVGTGVYGEPALGVSGGGNAAAAWQAEGSEGEYEIRGAIRDATAPALTLQAPGTAVAGEATVMGAVGGEDAGPISYGWSFGDGIAAGGAVVSHVFAIPGTYTVGVTATDSAENSTTLTATIEVRAEAAAGEGDGRTGGSAAPIIDAAGAGTPMTSAAVRPRTTLLSKVPRKTDGRRLAIRFAASDAGSSFECAIDSTGWRPCRSPLVLKALKPGAHKVKVRAISSGGLLQASPTVIRFRVLGSKHGR